MNKAEMIERQVKGFLVPIFQENPDSPHVLNGLAAGDFEKVRQGYACGRCLAEFHTYTVRCPVCGTVRDVENDIRSAPSLWLEHIRERDLDVPPEKPAVVNPFSGQEGPSPLPEMETIPVRKLKRRWGRG